MKNATWAKIAQVRREGGRDVTRFTEFYGEIQILQKKRGWEISPPVEGNFPVLVGGSGLRLCQKSISPVCAPRTDLSLLDIEA